ncbi:type II toxin-antitoxin system HicB family antitoxin [Pseudomonas sp. R2.Fl]|nr:type II toxin-antitoxin system HicB family antitoxin [Pseudomonas sp. R2.Fl]
MRTYIGVIHRDEDSDYGVSFPDFPGVVTAGIDLDDACRMAEEALSLHVEGMIEDGEAIPEPSAWGGLAIGDAVAVVVPLKMDM